MKQVVAGIAISVMALTGIPRSAGALNASCPNGWVERDLAEYIAYSEEQGEDEFFESIGLPWPEIGYGFFGAADANGDGQICTKKYPVIGQGKPDFYDLRRDNITSQT